MSPLPPLFPRLIPGTLTVAASIVLAWVLVSWGPLASVVLFLLYLAAASGAQRILSRNDTPPA